MGLTMILAVVSIFLLVSWSSGEKDPPKGPKVTDKV